MSGEPVQEAYSELSAYTLTRGDAAFIHQYVVDAFAAQRADEDTKPIALTFALAGLYLHVERGFTGRQVQRVHMLLAQHRKKWPRFELPEERGSITPLDVMNAPPGPQRDEMIREWSRSVWQAYGASHSRVITLLEAELG